MTHFSKTVAVVLVQPNPAVRLSVVHRACAKKAQLKDEPVKSEYVITDRESLDRAFAPADLACKYCGNDVRDDVQLCPQCDRVVAIDKDMAGGQVHGVCDHTFSRSSL